MFFIKLHKLSFLFHYAENASYQLFPFAFIVQLFVFKRTII